MAIHNLWKKEARTRASNYSKFIKHNTTNLSFGKNTQRHTRNSCTAHSAHLHIHTSIPTLNISKSVIHLEQYTFADAQHSHSGSAEHTFAGAGVKLRFLTETFKLIAVASIYINGPFGKDGFIESPIEETNFYLVYKYFIEAEQMPLMCSVSLSISISLVFFFAVVVVVSKWMNEKNSPLFLFEVAYGTNYSIHCEKKAAWSTAPCVNHCWLHLNCLSLE